MSDSTTLTRCPHCQTRFRVTEQQLGVAAGKVRCGHCMEVFNAREHKAAADPEPVPTVKPEVPPSRNVIADQRTTPVHTTGGQDQNHGQNQDQDQSDHDSFDDEFIFQDNPEEDATDSRYNQAFKSDDDFSDSFLALDRSNQFDAETDDSEQIGEVDESWAEEILHDDALLSSRPRTTSPSEPEPMGKRDTRPPGPIAEPPKTASGPARSQSRPNPRPPGAAAAPQPKPQPRAEQPLKATSPEHSPGDPIEELSLSVEADDIRFGEPESKTRAGRADRMRASPATTIARPYDNLRSRPVDAGRRRRGLGMTLLWALGCLLLIGFVASQLFYFQVERLSRYEALRPLYAAVCPLIGCNLPEMVDTDQIESRKLVVRSHPEEPQALLVEALIVNQAPFAQPFPAIVLTFSNLNNDIVAQRSFKPEEYLAGEAQGMESMPAATPVKIALELRDPGQDAVNYSLRFLPAPSVPSG